MSIGLRMGPSLSQSHTLRLDLKHSHGHPTQWSLVSALGNTNGLPPEYVEPTYEEKEFTPHLRVSHMRYPGYDSLPHLEKLQVIDSANKLFRYEYYSAENEDGETEYYRVPLQRNINVEIEDIAEEIGYDEYIFASELLKAVGQVERIVRAIPYKDLYDSVRWHLERQQATLAGTVLVSVDRGGRLPCMILKRALGMDSMLSLKVNQGGSGDSLDEDRIAEFISSGALKGKHVLFVDSTVDSGRQITVLERYFNDEDMQEKLGHTGWSIVGSNDEGCNLTDNHSDINWGVDPDTTFEDDPNLMGIDYAPGHLNKVIEAPTETSERIREFIFMVPDGRCIDMADLEEQVQFQEQEWNSRKNCLDHILLGITERRVETIVSTPEWQAIAATPAEIPEEELENEDFDAVQEPAKLVIIGDGKETLPRSSADYIGRILCRTGFTVIVGTTRGNPGMVLTEINDDNWEHHHLGTNTKNWDRLKMIKDAHAVLALGGSEGTLCEILLALQFGKTVVMLRNYGTVSRYLLEHTQISVHPKLIICDNLKDAMEAIIKKTSDEYNEILDGLYNKLNETAKQLRELIENHLAR